jgi:hypothetical protein
MVGTQILLYRLLFDSITHIITDDGPLIPVSQYLTSLSDPEKAVFLAIYVCPTHYFWTLKINTLMQDVSRAVCYTYCAISGLADCKAMLEC